MVQCSMRSFRVKRIDDDSPLVPAEWPSTTSHNIKVFEEIRPNTRMMKKIYMVYIMREVSYRITILIK